MVKDIGVATADYPSDYSQIKPRLFDRLLALPSKDRLTISPLRTQTFSLKGEAQFKDSKIIHLHNLHPDYFNFLTLPSLSKAKPVVWTIHDMWPITGHCGFSIDCERWRSGCGKCPYLNAYPGVSHDWTSTEWKLKRWALSRSRIHVITPSQWLADCVREGIGRDLPVSVLPYGLDTQTYSPSNQAKCKEQLALEPKRFTILLASANLRDPRKPQDILCHAINAVAHEHPDRLQVLTFGNGDLRNSIDARIPVTALGHLASDTEKVRAYSSADITLFSSRGDNLPLIIQESMACGVPVIANRIGGIPDMVKNETTGLLVEGLTSEEFHAAISRLISNPSLLFRLKSAAREFAVKTFELENHVQQTESLYENWYESFNAN
ncbi:glycosyl transferase group 1/2 family protein [Cerasicoccus arenae]|uniref:Glycosyl transferase group 1/2 family protein n=2 Tax=Cerasicoccus arenae TaxID=424488 RepID=A0A8J3DI19_9BACT|nr:glycosyl transferase group 1/2 family protein [Cerasicoccus arenae]